MPDTSPSRLGFARSVLALGPSAVAAPPASLARRASTRRGLLAFSAAALALGGVACMREPASGRATAEGPVVLAARASLREALDTSSAPPAVELALAGTANSIADVVETVLPSVVSITVTKVEPTLGPGAAPGLDEPRLREFFGNGAPAPRERRSEGQGSGVVVDAEGVILTNNHVIDGARDIRVRLGDGREVRAKVIGTDPQTDLAVLRLDEKLAGLRAVRFGDSSRLRLGEVVLAVGNPFGVGQTVTQGIVSAKGRANVGIVDYEDFIQTDAAINPGNSGGALVNMGGELVGINTAILSRSGGANGIGFAIPSDMARRVLESLLADGSVHRGRLGVVIQELSAELAEALKLGEARGVLVSDVQPGSAAAKAGLRRRDVITAVDGVATETTGKLRNLVALAGAGRGVKVELLRDGARVELSVTLDGAASEKRAEPAAPTSDEPEPAEAAAGLQLASLTPALRSELGVSGDVSGGVVVSGVAPDSPAAEAGLAPGDLILEVDGKAVSEPAAFRRALAAAGPRALILTTRGGQTRYVALANARARAK